jgi:hypothetical protein
MGTWQKATLEKAVLINSADRFFNSRNWDFIVPQMNNSGS